MTKEEQEIIKYLRDRSWIAKLCQSSDAELKFERAATLIEQQAKRIEELEKDWERLDWLDANRAEHIYGAFKYHSSNAATEKSWRNAIDAAIRNLPAPSSVTLHK